MKAILMAAPGAPDALRLADVLAPELADPHEPRVRVHAAGANPLDTKIHKLHFYYPDHLPAIPACDGAGVVERVGAQVTRFAAGDEMYFFNGGLGREPGTYAQYTRRARGTVRAQAAAAVDDRSRRDPARDHDRVGGVSRSHRLVEDGHTAGKVVLRID